MWVTACDFFSLHMRKAVVNRRGRDSRRWESDPSTDGWKVLPGATGFRHTYTGWERSEMREGKSRGEVSGQFAPQLLISGLRTWLVVPCIRMFVRKTHTHITSCTFVLCFSCLFLLVNFSFSFIYRYESWFLLQTFVSPHPTHKKSVHTNVLMRRVEARKRFMHHLPFRLSSHFLSQFPDLWRPCDATGYYPKHTHTHTQSGATCHFLLGSMRLIVEQTTCQLSIHHETRREKHALSVYWSVCMSCEK